LAGAVATITIDRAERLNAINESVLTAALSCLERAASAEEAAMAFLEKRPPVFSSPDGR
jgi:enoyl-CoA hydratase/carnithine racemase